jgi:hypothetical protein
MGVPAVEVGVVWDELRSMLCPPRLVHGHVHGLLVQHAERYRCPGNGVNALHRRAAGQVERRREERGEERERERREREREERKQDEES